MPEAGTDYTPIFGGAWNYRVFHRMVPDGLGEHEDEYTIREAYYDQNGQVHSWTEQPASPLGSTREGLSEDMSCMSLAFSKPVVELTADGSALAPATEFVDAADPERGVLAFLKGLMTNDEIEGE
jgi:hypothetical protein